MSVAEDVGELQRMIDAGEDVVRRLRARADDIEKDVAALRAGLAPAGPVAGIS